MSDLFSPLLISLLITASHHTSSSPLISHHPSSLLSSPLLSSPILICTRDDLLWSLEGKMPRQRLHKMHFDVRSAPSGECTYSINFSTPYISMPLHCLSPLLPIQSFEFSVDWINLPSYLVFHVPSILSQSSSFLFSSLTLFFLSFFHLPLPLLVLRRPNGLTSLLHFYSRINSFWGHLTAR